MDGERVVKSRDELWAMASDYILGPELLREVERLESEGVVFYEDLDDHRGPYPARVRVLMLGQGAPGSSEASWNVAPRRDEALALARKDPDFLQARLEDFSHWRAEEESYGHVQEHVYVYDIDSRLISALAQYLGYNGTTRQGVYYIEEGAEWNRSRKALLGHDFEERLAEKAPSWLDLLRAKEDYVRETAQKYLGDPAEPETVALRLIDRRLANLGRELDRTLEHERWLYLQEQERLAAESTETEVADAWAGFFDGGEDKPAPELQPLAEAGRERSVAPSLSEDADLSVER